MAVLATFLMATIMLLLSHGTASSPVHIHSMMTDERQLVNILVTETRSLDSPYEVHLTVFNQTHHLTLGSPKRSIFSTGFTFGTSALHKSDLATIEENIYVDYTNKAALSIVYEDGVHKIDGNVNGIGIRHHSGTAHHATRPLAAQKSSPHWCGVVDSTPMLNVSMMPSTGHGRPLGAGTAVVEIQAVFDKSLAEQLGNDQANITRYAALTFHAVSAIYEDLTDPTFTLKLAGVVALSDVDDQKIVQATGQKIDPMLDALTDWVSSSPAGLGPSDVVALLTGVVTLNNDGEAGTVGLAFRGGVCQTFRTSVNQDVGAAFAGITTVAHEIGHNLGATHDFSADLNTCGEHGYIMGYAPGTPNYFHFSSCSKKEIRAIYGASRGNCLKEETAGVGIPLGSSDPGQEATMTLTFQCNKAAAWMPGTNAIPLTWNANDNPTNKMCSEMVCRYPDGYTPATVNLGPPVEGTPCNQGGGTCRKGLCV